MKTKFNIDDDVEIITDNTRGLISAINDRSPESGLAYDEPVYRVESTDGWDINEAWFEAGDLDLAPN